jgi:hypothetical protein
LSLGAEPDHDRFNLNCVQSPDSVSAHDFVREP